MKVELKRLLDAAYDIIYEEGLPKPEYIRFIVSLNGTKHRCGTCFLNNNNHKYRIKIYTVEQNFIKCKDGEILDKETNIRYKKILGRDRTYEEIKSSLAHEIAHLKYWQHPPEHVAYTKHILCKISQKIGE